LFSACSHAGIVNACLTAMKHFRRSPVDVVLGGYHLAGKAMESRIERKRLLTTAPFVLDFQRAGQAAARGGAAKPTFQGNSWAMRLIG